MKHFVKLAAVAVLFTFGANIAKANDKIGFADPAYLLQNHPVMVETAAKIEKILADSKAKFADEEKKLAEEDQALAVEFQKIEDDAKKLQEEKEKVEASLKKKVAALEKEAPRLRSKDIQARQKAIQDEEKAFQNKVEALQKREVALRQNIEAFEKKVAELQQKLQDEQSKSNIDTDAIRQKAVEDINNAVKVVADAKGYTVVLYPSAAFYAKDDKANITEDVLAELKAKVKTTEQAAEQAK
ncbi:MAG: OmpH family outer membrane protein [Pasteurellaceae bacterium]|nr:OmpH family outer membrane protein [Pasteurellaceae bacterium]